MAQAQIVIVHTEGDVLLQKMMVYFRKSEISGKAKEKMKLHIVKTSQPTHIDVHLEVFKTLWDEVFDPERQLELVNLLLVGEVGEDCGAAAILAKLKL